MNIAKELLDLEEKKKQLLKKSTQEASSHFNCFVTLDTIQVCYNPKEELKHYRTQLEFEIIGVSGGSSGCFYSIEFEINLDYQGGRKKDRPFEYTHSCSLDIKDVNASGLLFINHYNELTQTQKTQYKNSLEKLYEKIESAPEYDCVAIPKLNMRGIIDYIKSDTPDMPLKDFIKQINKKVPTIVKNHLSELMVEKIQKSYPHEEKVTKTYQLTTENKKNLIQDIKKNFLSLVEKRLSVKHKEDGSYKQDWERRTIMATIFFNEKEKSIKSLKRKV